LFTEEPEANLDTSADLGRLTRPIPEMPEEIRAALEERGLMAV
jgi:hypothetical protein